MKKFIVMLEEVKRRNGEIGYCDPSIREEFEQKEDAEKFYNSIDVKKEYERRSYADNKESFFRKTICIGVYDDEDGDFIEVSDWLDSDDYGEIEVDDDDDE